QAFYDSVQGLDVDNLRQNVLMYSKYLQETMAAQKASKEISEAENTLKAAKQPFVDKIKEHKDKIKQLKRFVDDKVCIEALEEQMVVHTSACEDQKIKMDDDAGVRDSQDILKELKGPFSDAKKVLDLKIAYLNILISEKQG